MNWEEVQKVIEENNLQDQVAVWAAGTEKGKELLSNFSEVKVKEAVDARTREIHEGYDKDLQELGIDKAGRKTYQAIKDELSAKAELSGKVAELQAQLEKGQTPDEALTAQITSLQEALKGKDTEVAQLKSEAVNFRKSTLFDSAISGLKFDERHDKTLIDTFVQQAKRDFLANSEFDNDKFIIKDAQGQVMLNNEHRPMDANEALKSKFSNLLSTDKPKGLGAGDGTTKGKGATLSVSVDTSSLNGKEGLAKKQAANNLLRQAYTANNLDIHSTQFKEDYRFLTKEK